MAATTPRAYRALDIGFGLINIGIKIGSVFKDSRVGGKYLCPVHETPVSQRWECEGGEEGGHIVVNEGVEEKGKHTPITGYAVGNDEYVIPAPDELEAIKQIVDKEMEITDIVPVSSIEPGYYESTYHVWPDQTSRNIKAFAILSQSLRESDRAAVGTVCLNKTTRKLVLRYSERWGTMLAHLCRFDEDVRWDDLKKGSDGSEGAKPPTKAEIAAARPLLASLDGDFDPAGHRDIYREALLETIEARANGKPVVAKAKDAVVEEDEPDLLDALRNSVKNITEKQNAKKPKAPAKKGTRARATKA